MKAITLPKDILHCLELLEKNGYESFIVGGAIRNSLLGMNPDDYDMTSSATPEEAMAVFDKIYPIIPTGINHGTVTIQTENRRIELTTLRQEDTYQDHRHPNQVSYTKDVYIDSTRRDFTINALYYHPKTGILDFHHGIDDLKHLRLQTIGPAKQRFLQDSLRILRALRFQAKYHFIVTDHTAMAMHQTKENLHFLSQERIMEELKQIIIQPYFKFCFEEFIDIFACLFQHSFLDTAISAIKNCSNTAFSVRFAILLQQSNTSINHFKLDRQTRKECEELLAYANTKITSKIDLKKILSRLKQPIEQYISFKKAIETTEQAKIIETWYNEIITNKECFRIQDLDLSINDLLKLKISPKDIKKIQESCLEMVISEKIPNQKQALLQAITD